MAKFFGMVFGTFGAMATLLVTFVVVHDYAMHLALSIPSLIIGKIA